MRFIVTYQPDEDGGFTIECPALPGCVSHGATESEALANIGEAIRLSLETRRELGLPGPPQIAEIEVAA